MLSGFAGRVVYAILAGVVAFLVVYIIGAVVMHFDATIGGLLEQWSPLIGLLVGQLAIGLQTRIAAPEPPRRRRRARSRRRLRLPFHTKGVGLVFHPSTVCSNQSMIC